MVRHSHALYHPTILDHNRNPSHFREIGASQHIIKAYNTMCGDKYVIGFDLRETIISPSFHGYGCAVSKAATSLLMEGMQDQTVETLRLRCIHFINFLEGNEPCPAFDMRLEVFIAVRKYPERLQCAILSWQSVLRVCDQLLNELPETV